MTTHLNKLKIRLILLILLVLSVDTNAALFDSEESLLGEEKILNQGFNVGDFTQLDLKQNQLSGRVESDYRLIVDLIKQKKFDRAKEKVSLLIEQDPNQSVFYVLKAFLEVADKDFYTAEQSLLKAVLLDETNTQAFIGLAKLALDTKRYDQARQYANKALLGDQYSINAYKLLAEIALRENGIDAAERVLLNANTKVKDSR